MLSVPYTLVLVPRWQALAGIVFVGATMSCTANALLHAYVHAAARAEFESHALGAGSKFVGFQSLAQRAGGQALGYAVSVIMATGVYGGCVGNIQNIRDLTPFVVKLMINDLSETGQGHVKQIVMWALLALVLLPLCMLRKLSALQPTNYMSFVLSIYLVGAVVCRSSEGYSPMNNNS